MCGIAAILSLTHDRVPDLAPRLGAMNALQQHRGPDGEGVWEHPHGVAGLGHRRLAVIDVASGGQPMTDATGSAIAHNGEIYNYRELRAALGGGPFRTASDTEVLLCAFRRWGMAALDRLRGMFAFALWDEPRQTLVCARDRCGLKPLYYAVTGGTLYAASEIKALLPFLPSIETDPDGYRDYRTFQCCLGGRTMFKGVAQLEPGQWLRARHGVVETGRYWAPPELDAAAESDTAAVEARLRYLVQDAITSQLRSDVPVGVSLSGGLDSSIVASCAAIEGGPGFAAFTGTFPGERGYDETAYARCVAEAHGLALDQIDIGEREFVDHISDVVFHLDQPVAGPGALPQFVVNRVASGRRTVLLTGQGGDELFGGYARYLIASGAGEAAVGALGDYTEALQRLAHVAPGDVERRYFRLIDRSGGTGGDEAFETFRDAFRQGAGASTGIERMLRFDFRALLPALLHVEDRVSMAHGVESRAPLVDDHLVAYAMTLPAALKIRDGVLKHALRRAMRGVLPDAVLARRDKMGFPVPFQPWLSRPGLVRDFVRDVLSSSAARTRGLPGATEPPADLTAGPRFDRRIWGQLCLELWFRRFHDEAAWFRRQAAEQVTT